MTRLYPLRQWLGAANAGSAAHATYRPDIDGLRAIAVIPVVLYHLNISLASGGFVGVDVFFVISGYLITGLIWAEMQAGAYSIANFYVRRARRIFPALFFMCAVCAVFVFLICLPGDAQEFSKSLAAATLFASNIYFYRTADYFAPGADTQALLHIWSLAVEEQFYILFPLVLLAVRRFAPTRAKAILAVLAALSLGVSIWLVRTDLPAAFYLLHSRAWELLIGALLALGTVPAIGSRALAATLGMVGLALIGASVLLYQEQMPFPGVAALAPCLGAALLIHVGRDGTLLPSRLLSLPPLRFVGLISYSLYLWHWPIDVLSRNLAFWYGWDPDTKPHKIVALALSVACAILSWHLAEKPFRQRPYRFGPLPTLSASAAIMAVLVAFSAAIYPLSERFWRMPQAAEQALATRDYRSANGLRDCFLAPKTDDFRLFNQSRCLAFSDTKKNWLLIGDSQAADLWTGLAAANPEINLLQATASGCKPLLDAPGERRCTDLMRFLFTDFIPKHRFDAILISARWRAANIDDLRRTAEALKPFAGRVVVLGPHVEYKQDLPWLVAASIVRRDPAIVERSRMSKQRRTDRLFAERLRSSGILYVSIYQAVCPDGRCRITDADGLPLAFDYGHLTPGGSLFVAQEIRKAGAL